MPPTSESPDELQRRLDELKDSVVRDALTEIRQELRIVRKRQHSMAGTLTSLQLKVAIIESRAATWGAAGAAVVTVLGILLQWFHK